MDSRDKYKGYKKLKVWQKAHELVLLVYKATEKFPKSETYGLVSQINRATISVAANIVEGQASDSKKDFHRFLIISNKSLVELEYLLEAAKDLKMLSDDDYEKIELLRQEVGCILNGLIKSVRSKLY